MYFFYLSLSSVVLIDSSTGSPVHVLMLSIQAVHGLPRLHAPGIVPCIISFSRQLLVYSLCDHGMLASFLALTVANSSVVTAALLRTHSFVFFAVHETCRIFLGPFISKASRRVSSFFLSVQLSQPCVATRHKISPIQDWRSTPTHCQLQSHVTQKLGQKWKNPALMSFRYCALI